jgi:SurA N-terminal domain
MKGNRQCGRYPATARAWILLGMMLLASWGAAHAADVIDRIVATVNQHAILESEWEEAVRVECLLNSRPLGDVSRDDRRQTLERLIDQELIAEQMRVTSLAPATDEDIARRVRDLRQTVAAWNSDDGWRAALAAYGLTEEDVDERIAVQVDLTHYLDLRFRPEIHIDRRAAENYYRQQLIPQLRRAGAPEPRFEQVFPMIEQLLVEQRLNELQGDLVRTLRQQADIRVP